MQIFTPPPPVQIDTSWFLDHGPFFDRFGASKYAVLTSNDANVKAVVADVQSRKWVDLKNPAVAQGIDTIITAGVPGVDATLKASILNQKAAAAEQFALIRLYFT